MLYSASWNESFIRSGGSTESMYLKAHIMRVLIGFVFMFIFLILMGYFIFEMVRLFKRCSKGARCFFKSKRLLAPFGAPFGHKKFIVY